MTTVPTIMPPTWDLLFFLPNLNVPQPTPYDAGVVRICAGDDPVIHQLHTNPGNATARQMLVGFRGQYGRSYLPGCFIVSTGAPPSVRTSAALRTFRNCCAIATILPAYEGNQWEPRYADHFDIYPLSPGNDGSVVTNDAIVRGLQQPQGFSGQCSPLIQSPWDFTCHPSQRLLGRLIQAWRLCYLTRRRRRPFLRLFRSLEIALHACRFPTDSLMSVYDAGLRLVVWVSAFEVLLHPGGQSIDLPAVLTLIRSLSWRDRHLTHRRYRVRYRNVPPLVSLPEAIYYDLYMARNDFVHGNQIPGQALWFRRNRRLGYLTRLAPLLYRAVLEQQLDLSLPSHHLEPPPNAPLQWLLTAKGQRYIHERASEWGDRASTESALLSAVRQ